MWQPALSRAKVCWQLASVVLTLLICGCQAGVRETHYFASFAADKPIEPVNFFRLDVVGKHGVSTR